MTTTKEKETGIRDQSLTEALETTTRLADRATLIISVGEMWIQKRSDVSYSVSAVLGKLVCSHKRLTVVLSQLHYWMAGNGYATSLPVPKLLTSWCGGSVLLMELIEAGMLMQWWEQEFLSLVPELVSVVAQIYVL